MVYTLHISTILHGQALVTLYISAWTCVMVQCFTDITKIYSEFGLYTSLNAAPEIPQVLTEQKIRIFGSVSTVTAQLYTSLKTEQLYTNISITCYFTG